MDYGSSQVTISGRCWKPMRSRLARSNFNNYHQTTPSRWETSQRSWMIPRGLAYSEIYLRQERYDVALAVEEMASRTWRNKFLGYLKRTRDYCLVVVEERGELLVFGNILRFRLEWEQKPQKVNVRSVPCNEQVPIVQLQPDTEDH